MENVFQRYGEITMTRIQKNRNGDETRSAMVCFTTANAAAQAIDYMREDGDWEVSPYVVRERQLEKNRRNTSDYQQDRQNQEQGNKEQRQQQHWTLSKPSFFGNQDEYSQLNRQKTEPSITEKSI